MKNLWPFVYFLSLTSTFAQMTQFSDWAGIGRCAADNQKLAKVPRSDSSVVLMGNSITEFWQVIDPAFFEGKPYFNRGISGQTTPQMLLRFRQDVIDLQPKMVVILAGINDIAENTGTISLETTFGNIASMAELALANQIKVVLCSVLPAYDFPWRPGMKPADKVIQLNGLIKRYAEKNKLAYIDYFAAMVDERNGLDKKYTNDEVHPNLLGYRVMAPLLEKGIADGMAR